jgi:hypothetical protein
MIRWAAYSEWFRDHYDVLKYDLLEPGCIEIGPILEPKDRRFPRQAPFGADWAVLYDDGYYFRVKEAFNRMGRPQSGMGLREHFSYHYGRAHPRVDAEGFPLTQEPDTPFAELRIDVDRRLDPHIHVNSPDHITQDRVHGYSIKDADMIAFLRAVVTHRKSKEPLHKLLGITILP